MSVDSLLGVEVSWMLWRMRAGQAVFLKSTVRRVFQMGSEWRNVELYRHLWWNYSRLLYGFTIQANEKWFVTNFISRQLDRICILHFEPELTSCCSFEPTLHSKTSDGILMDRKPISKHLSRLGSPLCLYNSKKNHL